MKTPPKPPAPGKIPPLGTPRFISDLSVVGSCRIPFTEPNFEANNTFLFEVILWEDDEITLKKLIEVKSDTIKNAYVYMIKNYPKPYYFALKSF